MVGENNIINEVWVSRNNINKERISTRNIRYEILYNSSAMPTRIDKYSTVVNSSNNSQDYKTHTYDTYEYREVTID